MFRAVALWKLCNKFSIASKWIVLTPYGFWYVAAELLKTDSYTIKTVNTLLLLPIPFINLLAVLTLFIRYSRVKYLVLKELGFVRWKRWTALLPFGFTVNILLMKA